MDTNQITDRERRFLRAILPPRQTRKSQEDRLKAVASALQTMSLSVIGVGIITPFFTSQMGVNWRMMMVAAGVASSVEVISLLTLAYIQYPPDKESSDHE
ncbi:hypothetical protein FOH24_16440 [Acetobacter tropicalis]|uniref:Uncharacterized protein n=2 Tax=Acetobacter TaxID=434 RepID=A0A6N3T3Q2_9PROT|nr:MULTISPECIES: hypothetical protein [Acetobacter]KAA8384947.1 hypothetical protein FOH24_16440 [Acetobacter tropicalis]KAA8388492.1 hypothetical protein FOH22_08725 [Acetobacter tropicalis]KGB24175.1 hypothetical protein AtDm6_1320 [Acetobacter tropicalis]MBC9010024.1 hypothetical protein [Acetobacter tropicalis]GAN63270.1 hypothetical protein Abin_024_055 [Acetobacter indonesiensis]